MWSFPADGEPSAVFGARVWDCKVTEEPAVAVLYAIAGALMEFVGPMFWAALIVLYVRAELFTG
jgi:hypothetical protein